MLKWGILGGTLADRPCAECGGGYKWQVEATGGTQIPGTPTLTDGTPTVFKAGTLKTGQNGCFLFASFMSTETNVKQRNAKTQLNGCTTQINPVNIGFKRVYGARKVVAAEGHDPPTYGL